MAEDKATFVRYLCHVRLAVEKDEETGNNHRSSPRVSFNYNFGNFRDIFNDFSTAGLLLVTRKGVFAYEYVESWDKLVEIMLTKSYISNEEFEHVFKF